METIHYVEGMDWPDTPYQPVYYEVYILGGFYNIVGNFLVRKLLKPSR
jgi:hypothetical protein